MYKLPFRYTKSDFMKEYLSLQCFSAFIKEHIDWVPWAVETNQQLNQMEEDLVKDEEHLDLASSELQEAQRLLKLLQSVVPEEELAMVENYHMQ